MVGWQAIQTHQAQGFPSPHEAFRDQPDDGNFQPDCPRRLEKARRCATTWTGAFLQARRE